ncbi:gamma-glutamyl kinase [Szabonella alba]|uniref:Gamma-glutamyl kinase n=1 Tax=Szabonella alba TaxID=2804194 RepID=A0A8K0XYE8_9RHOB|nr:gamma-glutamyl kinase [Szabonella alba]MBL4915990.1 gamma-glutamyl kinase [Szabonella alba]
MLILPAQRLVVLEVPKTGSLALRAMLEPFSAEADLAPKAPRHIRAEAFDQRFRTDVEAALGGPVELVAVLREPLRRLQSWYRYRRREQVSDSTVSTRAVSFNDFVTEYLAPKRPDRARLGRQDRFVGWDGARALVDHLFDYRRTDLLVDFLSQRMAQPLRMPLRNISPDDDMADYTLDEAVLTRLLKRNSAEFALYSAVREAGHMRSAPGEPESSGTAQPPDAGRVP